MRIKRWRPIRSSYLVECEGLKSADLPIDLSGISFFNFSTGPDHPHPRENAYSELRTRHLKLRHLAP